MPCAPGGRLEVQDAFKLPTHARFALWDDGDLTRDLEISKGIVERTELDANALSTYSRLRVTLVSWFATEADKFGQPNYQRVLNYKSKSILLSA